jgi:hypothetical protein
LRGKKQVHGCPTYLRNRISVLKMRRLKRRREKERKKE